MTMTDITTRKATVLIPDELFASEICAVSRFLDAVWANHPEFHDNVVDMQAYTVYAERFEPVLPGTEPPRFVTVLDENDEIDLLPMAPRNQRSIKDIQWMTNR